MSVCDKRGLCSKELVVMRRITACSAACLAPGNDAAVLVTYGI